MFGLPSREIAVRASLSSVAVWWVLFSIPLFRRVPEPPRRIESRERPSGNALMVAGRRLLETFQELRAVPAGLRVPARLPDLQRRHPDDHSDGHYLRNRDRTRRQRDDRRAAGHAVHRHPVRVPVRDVRRSRRGQAGDLRRPGRLFVHQRARLLHALVHAVLCAGDPGRHGAGRHAGAEPLAFRQHDPEAQVVRILCVLQRVRALCRHPGTRDLRVGRRPQRLEPERHHLRAGVLHRGGRAPQSRGRCVWTPGGPAGGSVSRIGSPDPRCGLTARAAGRARSSGSSTGGNDRSWRCCSTRIYEQLTTARV